MSGFSTQENAVRDLYKHFLNAWNRRSARDYAALIEEDGSPIGFDGSQMNGQPKWEMILFQNTPAQFHGRPDLADALTAELRQLL